MGPDEVALTIGGELGGGAAFLNLAALRLLNELLPNEMKFKVQLYAYRGIYYVTSEILPNEVRIYLKPYPKKGTYYRIIATGEDAARFMRLLVGST
jgi:hypothetical protein